MARPRRKRAKKAARRTVTIRLEDKNAIKTQLRKAERGLEALTATVRALRAAACSANFMRRR